jgi:large subunit ribosomal protein L23
MSLFDKFKKTTEKKEKLVKKEKPVKKNEVKNVKKEKAVKKPAKPMKKESLKPALRKKTKENILIDKFLKSPWVTEKATDLAKQNKYIFKVDKKADKIKVKRAIEKMYDVQVIGVNIINIHPKLRRLGRTIGLKPGFKKAIVALAEGDKIEIIKA